MMEPAANSLYQWPMPTLAEIVGRNLMRVIESAGMTQKEFAAATGMPESTVSKRKHGGRMQLLVELEEAVRAIGADPSLLLDSSGAELDEDSHRVVAVLGLLGPDDRARLVRIIEAYADTATPIGGEEALLLDQYRRLDTDKRQVVGMMLQQLASKMR